MGKASIPRKQLGAVGLAVAALVGGALTAAAPASASAASSTVTTAARHHVHTRHLCAAPKHVRTMSCLAEVRTDVTQAHVFAAHAVSADATPSGYGPGDLLSAYNLPANGGAGQTVAIVDAQDDPNAEADLATYRSQYGLPACTTANGCF
ncbi:hypothetical protein SAMN05414137_16512, partial [Streptacidiphilus jiangxiensis]